MAKRGQAALEFMMTYGWMLIVAGVTVYALAYFGVINLKIFPEYCVLFAGLGCPDFAVNAAGNQIDLSIRNGMGNSIEMLSIGVDDCPTCSATLSPNPIPENGQAYITITSNIPIAPSESRFKTDLTILYIIPGEIERFHKGKLQIYVPKLVPLLPGDLRNGAGATDTKVYGAGANTVYYGQQGLFAGVDGSGYYFYSLMFYDISSAIPANAIIDRASLMLTSDAGSFPVHTTLALHKLTTNGVVLSSATYNKKDGLNNWAAGAFSSADYSSIALATKSHNVPPYSFNFSGAGLKNYIQDNVASGQLKFVILNQKTTVADLAMVRSSFYTTLDLRPRLLITYYVPR